MSRAEELRKTWLSPHVPHAAFVKRNQPPINYQAVETDAEQLAFLRGHSLLIFTEMANSGKPFADCLAAVFLTGLHYANEIGKEWL